MELPYDSTILLLGINPKEVQLESQRDISSRMCIQHYSQQPKVETTQLSVNKQINKQTVLCPYSGVLFTLKKEEIWLGTVAHACDPSTLGG